MKRIKLFEEFSSQSNIKDRFLELVDERWGELQEDLLYDGRGVLAEIHEQLTKEFPGRHILECDVQNVMKGSDSLWRVYMKSTETEEEYDREGIIDFAEVDIEVPQD
jgi:hypothetical protein